MALRVYFRDQNPAVDHFAFKQSNARAAEILERGEGEIITLPDGRAAIQLFRVQASREHWVERFEELTAKSTNPGMPFLKFIPPPTCGCGGASHGRCGLSLGTQIVAAAATEPAPTLARPAAQ